MLNIYSTLIWITSIILGSLGVVVYVGSNQISSRAFAFNIGLIFIWSLGVSFIPIQTDPVTENLILKFTFFMGTVISVAFFVFCKTFPENRPLDKTSILYLFILETIYLPIYLSSNLIIGTSYKVSSSWGWLYG